MSFYIINWNCYRYTNHRHVSSSDRALINAFRSISNMCDRINLPKTITDRANTLFKMVHDGRNLKGRANEAIASACLYIACRQEGVPRTFKEIVAVSTVSKKVNYYLNLRHPLKVIFLTYANQFWQLINLGCYCVS